MKTLATIVGGLALLATSAAMAAVNINSADAGTMQSLDGIGEIKAQAIVSYRDAHGAFESKDELTNVDGIGAKTLESIRGDITVGAD